MKKITFAVFFVVVAVHLPAQALSWDIKFLKGSARESVPVSQIIRMETKETFQIVITPAADCFSYIVLYDANREIVVLYEGLMDGSKEVFIGPFQVEDPPGTETLYVIMSKERQTGLEGLIQNHRNNSDSRQHSNNLYREVVSLQNAASGLGEPASTFIASGGTTRGSSSEYVTRFSGKALYVRTITIRH